MAEGEQARIQAVLTRLRADGYPAAAFDGVVQDVARVSVSPVEGAALTRWVRHEQATRTIEVGLAYGISALHICDALIPLKRPDARHVVLDPFQERRFANRGLQVLDEAGVRHIVEYHAEASEIALPAFLEEKREFDFAFVDGNHRFDHVFVDLFYMARLVRRGGIVVVDDYDLPGIARAVSFFLTNRNWSVEEESATDDTHQWIVLRTSETEDARDYRFFNDF